MSIAPFGGKQPAWHILDRLSGNMYVLSQTQGLDVRYAPLLIHHFALCAPRKILDATKFQQRYHRYEEIENVPDRLRWHRHIKGWMQKDVAQKIGISKRAYSNLENGGDIDGHIGRNTQSNYTVQLLWLNGGAVFCLNPGDMA